MSFNFTFSVNFDDGLSLFDNNNDNNNTLEVNVTRNLQLMA